MSYTEFKSGEIQVKGLWRSLDSTIAKPNKSIVLNDLKEVIEADFILIAPINPGGGKYYLKLLRGASAIFMG